MLRLCREGIEVVRVGAALLGGDVTIPTWRRVVGLIRSRKKFAPTVVRIPWHQVEQASLHGVLMERLLMIRATVPLEASEIIPDGFVVQCRLADDASVHPATAIRIAEAIQSARGDEERLSTIGRIYPGKVLASYAIELRDYLFRTPLDKIAAAIEHYASHSDYRLHLRGWDDDGRSTPPG